MTEIEGFKDQPVVDSAGAKLGIAEELYGDGTTGRPRWLKIKSRWLHHRRYFVALRGAQTGSKEVVVAFDKETVRRAPLVHHEGSLTPPEDAELTAYYSEAAETNEP